MAARLSFSSLADTLRLGLHSASPVPGVEVQFCNFSEYFVLYREIFVRQAYGMGLSSPRPVILDCGANIGLATIYFKRRFPLARVIAFEPNPDSFNRLAANIKRNDLEGIELRNEALGGSNSTGYLVLPRGTSESHAASIALSESNGSPSVPVQCILLSSVVENLERVDLVKLDIEGPEYEVLTDLERSGLLSRVGAFIIEYHERLASGPIESALSLLARNGFQFRLAVEWKPWYSFESPYPAMIYAARPRQPA